MQQLFEKKRRRRESHNAVERRRRDNINERINELATLLPDRDATKANKGTILRKSVDHIRALHDRLGDYQQRIQELESLLAMYRVRGGNMGMDSRQQAAAAAMIPSGHPLDLGADMGQHMATHDPFRRDG
ncbi:Myc-type, basic helix-loop-helix domain-containing protein [Fennellomyces sp. T-0311]|nr:Myc-type, basic helix-loop-helix domain-containing protein [Fennellomyces sp. T-0311]